MRMTSALAMAALLSSGCLVVQPGDYLCGERDACPLGMECVMGLCQDRGDLRSGRNVTDAPADDTQDEIDTSWVAGALSSMGEQTAHLGVLNYEHIVFSLEQSPSSEACSITSTAAALPASNGNLLKVIIKMPGAYFANESEISAGLSDRCLESPSTYGISDYEACAWLVHTDGDKQVVLTAQTGSLEWLSNPGGHLAVNLRFPGGSINEYVDYISCD